MKLTQEQVEGFAQSPRQVGVEEVADLCDDWLTLMQVNVTDFHNVDDIVKINELEKARNKAAADHSDAVLRIIELEAALKALRPFVQNITLRAVIDEALPPKYRSTP